MPTQANEAKCCVPVQEAVLSLGGVQRFVSLSQSMHHLLRLYGIWGLSSIAFRSTPGEATSWSVGELGRRHCVGQHVDSC